MSKIWPLLVLVSLKYCAEIRLLKTDVAFFMKVRVYEVKRTQLCHLYLESLSAKVKKECVISPVW
jgi:hypothetical protein